VNLNVNTKLNHNLTRQELNQQLNLKTTHSKLLKIHQLRTLREILVANPEALTAFHLLMDERHERAEVNSKQALEISRKEALIKKLEGFVDPSNSEILNLGKFIWSALKKTGQERKNELLKHDLVHKEDYNTSVGDLKGTIEHQNEVMQEQMEIAIKKIKDLEATIDSQKSQLSFIENYIVNNYGQQEWKTIKSYIQN
jgi:hypothetical protein